MKISPCAPSLAHDLLDSPAHGPRLPTAQLRELHEVVALAAEERPVDVALRLPMAHQNHALRQLLAPCLRLPPEQLGRALKVAHQAVGGQQPPHIWRRGLDFKGLCYMAYGILRYIWKENAHYNCKMCIDV